MKIPKISHYSMTDIHPLVMFVIELFFCVRYSRDMKKFSWWAGHFYYHNAFIVRLNLHSLIRW